MQNPCKFNQELSKIVFRMSDPSRNLLFGIENNNGLEIRAHVRRIPSVFRSFLYAQGYSEPTRV